MHVVTSIQDMQRLADSTRTAGGRIGLVPTMGFLHEGHMSLIDIARDRCSLVVMSIFVNPTQFGPTEDYTRYPRDEERDMKKAQERGCDIVFLPTAEEMYPEGFQTHLTVRGLSATLEGEFRPGHFDGVATIVAKLFNAVKPHVAVFGQKDAQQAIILRRMTRDMNYDMDVVVAPIVREPDGLAMSSRNTYLCAEDRIAALSISRGLRHAERLSENGTNDAQALRDAVAQEILRTGRIAIEYVRVVDAETLTPVDTLSSDAPALIAVAARVGSTRLIDNTIVNRARTI